MTPQEKTRQFVDRNYQREKDKWEAGMRNDYMGWDDFKSEYDTAMSAYDKSTKDKVDKINKEREKEKNDNQ